MGLFRWLTAAATLTPPPVQLGSPWTPPDVLTRITMDDLFPGVDSECWPITRTEAMTVPAVAAARHRIVGTLARLPMVAVKDDAPYTAGATGLLSQPDDGEPHATTMAKTLDDILFHGEAWWLVVKAYADGFPSSVVFVPRSDITSLGGLPSVSATFTDHLARCRPGLPTDAAGRVVLPSLPGTPADPSSPVWLIHFDGPHEGICTFGGRAIRSAVNLDRAAQHAADNPVPSIELHQTTDADMDDDDVAALITSWQTARRRGGVGYTNAAIDLRTHGQQPEQLLVDGRNQQAVEVARLAGIPAAAIDAGIPGTSLTYANLTDRLADLIQFGLTPYAYAVTGRLSMNDCLPAGVLARFDYHELYPAPPALPSAPSAAAPPTLRSVS